MYLFYVHFLTLLRGLVIVFPEPAFSAEVHISFSTLTFLSVNLGDTFEPTASGQGQAAARGGKAKPLPCPAHHPFISLVQRQGWPFPPLSYPRPDGASASHLQPCLRAEGSALVYKEDVSPNFSKALGKKMELDQRDPLRGDANGILR